MLTNSGGPKARTLWRPKRVLVFTLMTALLAALVGLIFGLGLGIVHRSNELSSAIFGSLFGLSVGLIVGLLVGSIRNLRDFGSASRGKAILVFTFLSAMAGALVLSPFSEGLSMMLVQAFEGAIAGALIGAILGAILGLVRQTSGS